MPRLEGLERIGLAKRIGEIDLKIGRLKAIERPLWRFERFQLAAEVASAGFSAGNRMKISIRGENIIDVGVRSKTESNGPYRGLYVVATHEGKTRLDKMYDLFGSRKAAGRLTKDLESLPFGTLVVIAAEDETSINFTKSAAEAMKTIGVLTDLRGKFRWSFLCIGMRGLQSGEAVEKAGPKAVEFP